MLARAEADGAPFTQADPLKARVVHGLAELSLTVSPQNRTSRRSRSEPPRPSGSAELVFLGGVLERGVVTLGRRGLATKEVDLHLADKSAAELGVADARPLVWRGRALAGDLRRDVVGDDQRG